MSFVCQIGTPNHQRDTMRSFSLLIREPGLPDFRFHDLRHIAASLLLNYNVPLIEVSGWLGHARVSITRDVYGHFIPSMQDEAAELIDELVTSVPVQIEQKVSLATFFLQLIVANCGRNHYPWSVDKIAPPYMGRLCWKTLYVGFSSGPGGIRTRDLFSAMDKIAGENLKIDVFCVYYRPKLPLCFSILVPELYPQCTRYASV
jgi:hypothetical protein